MAIKKVSVKLILLLIVAAIIPLLIFGGLAIRNVREATKQSVVQGNINTGRQAMGQIHQYTSNGLNILKSIAQNLNHADLQSWQIERVLKNYAINFDEFNSLRFMDKDGNLIASSELDEEEPVPFQKTEEMKISDVYITDDLTPAMTVVIPLKRLGAINGFLVAEFDLLNMWETVDQMTIGKTGYVNIVTPAGQIIATGHPKLKEKVFQLAQYPHTQELKELIKTKELTHSVLNNWIDETTLVVGTAMPKPLEWMVSIEQPTSEAYRLANIMTYELIALVILFILIMIGLGYFFGKREVVKPIGALIEGTKRVAKGDLTEKVSLEAQDEFGALAKSFNQMTDDLSALQNNIRRQERMAMFGRIASGLAHDLKHPVQAIKNAAHLMEKMYDKPDFRETFTKTVNREFEKIDLFLHDLHNITHDIPYNPMRISLNEIIQEVIDSYSAAASKQGIKIEKNLDAGDSEILADKIQLSRVFSNFISNSIDAMKDGGKIFIRSRRENAGAKPEIHVEITDTGCGIPEERVPRIFDDFSTTRRSGQGLGLGLAISKRILDQHGADISVESEVGKGTTFRLIFYPTRED